MWFSVDLLFQSIHSNGPKGEALWEERLVLIKAADEAEAQKEGERLGKNEEHEYEVEGGDRVRWNFYKVVRVCQIESETLGDKTELFSRFLRAKEVESLLTPFDD